MMLRTSRSRDHRRGRGAEDRERTADTCERGTEEVCSLVGKGSRGLISLWEFQLLTTCPICWNSP